MVSIPSYSLAYSELTTNSPIDLSSDANFVFVSGSAEFMLGYKTEDIRGRSYFNYIHPGDSSIVRHVWSHGLQTNGIAMSYRARLQVHGGRGWIGCDHIATVLEDSVVVCTSIHSGEEKRIGKQPDCLQYIPPSNPTRKDE